MEVEVTPSSVEFIKANVSTGTKPNRWDQYVDILFEHGAVVIKGEHSKVNSILTRARRRTNKTVRYRKLADGSYGVYVDA